MQNVIDEIVCNDQNGYIKNRFIGENIRTISDMIEYCSTMNQGGILTLIDFEKAFDTVRWPFFIYNSKSDELWSCVYRLGQNSLHRYNELLFE